MTYPELIFVISTLISLFFIFFSYRKYKANKKITHLIFKLFTSIIIIVFSFVWFIPIEAGHNGENYICKFRFQVFEYDSDDYGIGNLQRNLFEYRPKRYGKIRLMKRIGGFNDYFTFKIISVR